MTASATDCWKQQNSRCTNYFIITFYFEMGVLDFSWNTTWKICRCLAHTRHALKYHLILNNFYDFWAWNMLQSFATVSTLNESGVPNLNCSATWTWLMTFLSHEMAVACLVSGASFVNTERKSYRSSDNWWFSSFADVLHVYQYKFVICEYI